MCILLISSVLKDAVCSDNLGKTFGWMCYFKDDAVLLMPCSTSTYWLEQKEHIQLDLFCRNTSPSLKTADMRQNSDYKFDNYFVASTIATLFDDSVLKKKKIEPLAV